MGDEDASSDKGRGQFLSRSGVGIDCRPDLNIVLILPNCPRIGVLDNKSRPNYCFLFFFGELESLGSFVVESFTIKSCMFAVIPTKLMRT